MVAGFSILPDRLRRPTGNVEQNGDVVKKSAKLLSLLALVHI
jgi:hypothetical protein